MWHDIAVSNSLGASSTCPTDSMDVVVETRHWHVVVDDHHDILDIKTSGSNISSNKNVSLLVTRQLEVGIDLVSLPLLFVSVNGLRFVWDGILKILVPFQCFLKVITPSFGLAENNDLEWCTLVIRNQLDEELLEVRSLLLEVVHHVDHLGDVFVHGEAIVARLVSNFDVNWVVAAETVG